MEATAAIIPGLLFTGSSDVAERGRAVLLAGARILDIVPAGSVPRGIEVHDHPDATLLPGLVDVHCHLDEWVFPLCLARGITTVRDTGNNLEWILDARARSARSDFPGPRVLCAGPVLDGFPYIHPRISWGIRDPGDGALAVRTLKRLGVDAVKLYVGLTPALAEEIIKEARAIGLPTLAHVDSRLGALAVLGFGVGETEHLEGLPGTFDDAAVAAIVASGGWTVPTQVVWEALLKREDAPATMAAAFSHVPGRVLGYWEHFRKASLESDPGLARLRAACGVHRCYLRRLIEARAPIAVGTDSLAQFVVPGFAYVDELRVLADCGMRPAGVLRCATAAGARLLGIDRETGTVEPGKAADLLLVEGDPLQDLGTLERVAAVWRQGTRWDPARLLADRPPRELPSDSFPDPFEQATEWEDWKERYLDTKETP
jgi:imidazolonepropionase-like amidohydrolase